MTVINHMEQHVGGILSVGQVPDLVNDQYVGVDVGLQRLLQLSLPAGIGEIFDQLCGGGEVGFEAVSDGAMTDGHRQVSLSPAGLTVQNQGASFGDEVRSQVGTEQSLTKRRLQAEVELVDGFEEGKVRAAG